MSLPPVGPVDFLHRSHLLVALRHLSISVTDETRPV
jgi:hypothetical protein